jgi:glycerol-3-phosphate dehydrogenase (NAD(P)+)
MSTPTRIAVIGAGSWGTALAVLMSRNGAHVALWGRDPQQVAQMAAERRNLKYLPEAAFPPGLLVTASLEAALDAADLVLIVTPSHAFAAVVARVAIHKPTAAGVAWATKGFDPDSGRFLHEVAAGELPAGTPLAVVTGPSFAKEVALGLPTAVTVHSDDADFAARVAETLHSSHFRAYTGGDVIGAELGGAMKNVLAVATGVADGMQLGLNARAGLITRGLNEMLRLTAALGGEPVTIMGLAGVGDLVLTCTGDLSRNRRLGLALGRGTPLRQAVAEIGQVVESVQSVNQVMTLARRHAIELPISEQVQRVLAEETTPHEGLRNLLSREMKPEYPQDLYGSR